jgi:hypothetical protein
MSASYECRPTAAAFRSSIPFPPRERSAIAAMNAEKRRSDIVKIHEIRLAPPRIFGSHPGQRAGRYVLSGEIDPESYFQAVRGNLEIGNEGSPTQRSGSRGHQVGGLRGVRVVHQQTG